MTTTSKGLGVAAYYEFRKGTATFQFLAVPQIQHPNTGDDLPSRIYSRQISEKTPKKPWKCNPGTVVVNDYSINSVEAVITATTDNLAAFALMLNSVAQAGWTANTPYPVAVEIGPDDALDFVREDTPDALLRRVSNARIAAKYPKEVFDTQAALDAAAAKKGAK